MAAITAPPPARSRTQDAKLARRVTILAAARHVLARRGLRGTTVGDIAHEADIAVGTFYLYFPSKSAVFAALHELLFDTIDAAVSSAAAPSDHMLTATRARIGAAFDACWENRDLLRLIVLNADPRSRMARRLREANRRRSEPLARLLRLGMEAGIVRRDDPDLMARMINGMVSWAIYECYVLNEGQAVDAVQGVLARTITAALEPAPRTGGRP